MKKIKSAIAVSAAAALLLGLSACNKQQPAADSGAVAVAKDESWKAAMIKYEEYPVFDGNIGDTEIKAGDTYAVVSIKDFGDIKIKLFPDIAPTAVAQFKKYADAGYYTGKSIHRVLPDFMFQGGSADGTGASAPDEESFGVEVSPYARHFYGALCMANAAGMNGVQFYIVNNKKPDAYNEETEKADIYSNVASSMEDQISEAYAKTKTGESNQVNYQALMQGMADYYHYSALGVWLSGDSAAVKDAYIKRGGTPFLDGGYTVFGQTVDGFDVIDKISEVETTDGMDGAKSKPVTDIIIDSVVVKVAE